jgi:acetylornithine deacetylase/succinyl-diaminopimelate desuccinylase-like protein
MGRSTRAATRRSITARAAGARGGAGLEVTVYTAKSAMHSGNYGNWLPDANLRLAQLLASMVAPTGRIAIEGFYDDVLPFPPDAVKMMNEVFHVPTVGVSLANYDDNQHTDNENLRLGNLWNGIVTLAALMTK